MSSAAQPVTLSAQARTSVPSSAGERPRLAMARVQPNRNRSWLSARQPAAGGEAAERAGDDAERTGSAYGKRTGAGGRTATAPRPPSPRPPRRRPGRCCRDRTAQQRQRRRPPARCRPGSRLCAARDPGQRGAADGRRGAGHRAPPGGQQVGQQVEMVLGEAGMVGGGGDLGDAGEQCGARGAGRPAQPGERRFDELLGQPGEPAATGQRDLHAGAEPAGPQPGMARHRPARAGVPVQVQRVRQDEPDHVPQRLAGGLASLPVDDPADPAAVHEQVSAPVVAVHDRSGHPGGGQRGGRRRQPGPDRGQRRMVAEALGDPAQHGLRAGRRLRRAGRRVLQPGQPGAGGGEVGGDPGRPGGVPPAVVADQHRYAGQAGRDQCRQPVGVDVPGPGGAGWRRGRRAAGGGPRPAARPRPARHRPRPWWSAP